MGNGDLPLDNFSALVCLALFAALLVRSGDAFWLGLPCEAPVAL
jgi:hypothetical protein